MFSKLFGRKTQKAPPSTGGRLVYAVGDVHGRHDLLQGLVRQIARDAEAQNPSQQPLLVFLGDYVDRGPHSRQVVDTILALNEAPAFEVRALKGNHEEALLRFLEDSPARAAVRPLQVGTVLRPYEVFMRAGPSVLSIISRDASAAPAAPASQAAAAPN